MKALIIAGGLGTRLRPLTNNIPKCLVTLGKKTLLGRIIDSLIENDITNLVIITGHHEEKVRKFVKGNYPSLKSTFVLNPLYGDVKIRYIYAMWLAKNFLKDDIFYIHGDTFYDPVLIKRLKDCPYSGALVHQSFTSDKDFNARIVNGKISEIGVKVTGQGTGFCLPIYKLLKSDINLWLKKIGGYIKENNLDCYAENALNEITDRINLYPVYFRNEVAMEIDDFDDLQRAEKLLK